MKFWLGCALVCGASLPALAGEVSLDQARKLWLHGNYDQAAQAYQRIIKNPALLVAGTLGLSRAYQSIGQYDRGLAALDGAIAAISNNADLQARRAELLYLRGRWEEAEQGIAKALTLQKDHFLAHWLRGQLRRDRGDLKGADEDFRWFVRTYGARNDADEEIKDPEILLLVGMAGCENARWNDLPDQFQFVLNEVYGAALQIDKDYWPAYTETGKVYLEKYNRPDAVTAFDRALGINPKSAEALVGKGIGALQRYEIKDAESLADRALAINPSLVEALDLKADVYFIARDAPAARSLLLRARKINPRDEKTLGRLAAAAFLSQRNADLQELIHEVESRDAKPGIFYFALAEQLDLQKHYLDAERYYRRATELWPMLSSAPGALGMLYMRMGREPEARPLLERAFEADNFNVRVSNLLTVLDHLQKYETLKTPHFELRFDRNSDKYLAVYLAACLEKVYGDLSARFHYQLRDRVLVEVFNSHEMFSGRVVALPDLHTVGACTGRLLAMDSPHAKGIVRPFNWARVVRHELVHVLNLEQTGFQVPHWFTEGLAVSSEGYPRPMPWMALLHERCESDQLLSLDSIELGFVRPRSRAEWTLAYCQAQLYVEYLKVKFGEPGIGAMLDAYKRGLGTRDALARACGVSQDVFEQGYRAYVHEQLKKLCFKPLPKIRTLPELEAAHVRDRTDVDLNARLAEQWYLRRRTDEAKKLAEAVLIQHPSQPLASYVKASIILDAGDREQAQPLLEAALLEDPSEPKILRSLGKLNFEAKDYAKAAEMFEQGRRAAPYENHWLNELVQTYSQAGDKDKLIAVLKEVALNDSDDLSTRKQLTRIFLDLGQHEEAERYARQALEIDVMDPAAHENLADALASEKKWSDAIAVYRVATEQQPQRDTARVKLARALLESGDRFQAESEVIKVLAHSPDNAEAQRLKVQLGR
jgi:tetratricopeptide (TPR) repeat protein